MLLARNRSGDKEKAEDLLKRTLATAQELGMLGLEEKITSQFLRTSSQHPVTVSHSPPAQLFRREGDYWTITYHGVTCRLKSIRGLHYIAQLLRHPHQEFHVFDLVDLPQNETSSHLEDHTPGAIEQHRRALRLPRKDETLLDVQARTAYRKRLHELQEELREAQTFQDLGRLAQVQHEMEFLTQQLSATMGVGGQPRQAASQVEHARVNVTRGIKEAIQKIAAHNPKLERYLTTTIRTGLFCSFAPDPFLPLHWLF
jgi:hypothetical protein